MGRATAKSPPHARLHVLLARDAPVGVVIRRGPSKQVATLLWSRRTDEFTMGQWFKGRIYERRSDLSPDGKFLIYFAANHRGGEALGSWTAISIAPYIKALALFPKGDCWDGGGLWLTKDSYWLNNGHGVMRDTDLVHRDSEFQPVGRGNRECLGVYYPRLLRDGWTTVDSGVGRIKAKDTVFEKEIAQNWILRKIAHSSLRRPEGKTVYWDEHQLVNSKTKTVISFPDWEWADLDRKRLVWAEHGKLMSANLAAGGLESKKLLHDFNEMKFEAIAAPY
jgi:hypothetical protein